MANLVKILKDGTETGATLADKVNLGFDRTDANKVKTDMIAGTTAINFDEVLLDGDVATNSDLDNPNAGPQELARLVNNSGLRHVFGAKHETYSLEGNNPTMKMIIEAAGHAAQMQVVDKASGHMAATMEYLKATKEFLFTLFDSASGTAKATFELKQDGKGYIGTKEIVTTGFLTYDYIKLPSELVVAGTTWEDAMVLTTPSRVPGVYEIKWELLFTMNTVSKSAKFRYSIDDGATWSVLTREIKDKTNENTIDIWFPNPITTAQVFKIKVQVSKEDAGSVMKCKYGSIVVKRVK